MNKTLGTGSIDRSARVRRIKRVLIGIIIAIVILPSILCIILFAKLSRLEKEIADLSLNREIVNVVTESTMVTAANKSEPADASDAGDIKIEELTDDSKDTAAGISAEAADISDGDADTEEAVSEDAEECSQETNENADGTADDAIDPAEVCNDEASQDGTDTQLLKKVYLTFDDGPSLNTGKILDILNSYGVKGTFFVVGRLSDTTTPMYKRIVNEGHAIGMHSYTHKYNEIYANKDAFIYDIDRIQSLIYEQTGVLSDIYRFPGGSSNEVSRTDVSELITELDKRDITYYDWNVVSGDASSQYGLPKDQIVRNCTQKALGFEEAVILMHDLPEKATTVEALPDIIEYFQSIGVEIAAIDESAPIVHHEFN